MSAGSSCCAGCDFTGPRFLLLAQRSHHFFSSERIRAAAEGQLRQWIFLDAASLQSTAPRFTERQPFT